MPNDTNSNLRDRENEESTDVLWTRQSLFSVGAVAISFLLLYSCYGASTIAAPDSWWLVKFAGLFGTLASVGFAAFCSGGILGFLFGIPKSISQPGETKADTNASANESASRKLYRSNTNLEEMSDWLTKIIVGAGLVGLKDLLHYFERLVATTSNSLSGAPFAGLIVGADIVGFVVLGFFTVYLLTRLFLAGAFMRAEALLSQSQERAQSLGDMDFSSLSSLERDWLRRLIKARNEPTGLVIPDDFKRESDDHNALRSLKDRLILRVRPGGSFQPKKALVLTPLAEQILPKLQEASNQ
jgi:hypothetical protein